MSHFKKTEFGQVKIEQEADLVSGKVRIINFDVAGPQPKIEQYEAPDFRAKKQAYATTREKYGSLAITDEERSHREQRDRRFSLNPLLRGPLSVEDEERRVIEDKVQAAVDSLAEDARAKAHASGYKVGHDLGQREAFEAFQAQSMDAIGYFYNLMSEAENAKTEIFRANERFLMEVVFRLAKAVTLKELSVDPDYVLRLSKELIERMGVRENIRIRIHPDDLKTADQVKPGLERELGAFKNLNIEASNQVERGGCIVESEWSEIDASLETQFRGLYEALMGTELGSKAGGT